MCMCTIPLNLPFLPFFPFPPTLPPSLPPSHPSSVSSPLSFIFESTAYSGQEGIFNKVVPQRGEIMLANVTRCVYTVHYVILHVYEPESGDYNLSVLTLMAYYPITV